MHSSRYLARGKRTDNGAWETGSLVIVRGGTTDERCYIADKMTGHQTPVDPDTVEPVRVPVKRERTMVGNYRCPSCNAAFVDGYGITPYCGNCGQALEWEDDAI